jgi:hypothetical protein
MNPLPNQGTKILGIIITFLGTLQGVNPDMFGKYGPSIMLIIGGLLTTLRGFQNTANQVAIEAGPVVMTKAAPPTVVPTIKEKGYAYVNFLVFMIAVAATLEIAACATQAAKAAPTFNQLVTAASGVDDTVIGLSKSLYDQKVLTAAQVKAVIAITDKIQASLTLANTAFVAGNQTSATTGLTQASQAIAAVQVCLTNPATLVTCLSSVNPPSVSN